MNSTVRVAFGPVMPGWGSWDWIGVDLVEELQRFCRTQVFSYEQVPDAELIVIVKHPPPQKWFVEASKKSAIVYCPVDYYDSAAAIDADACWLSLLKHVVLHCLRMRRFFAPYAPVTYLDHHVKFIRPEMVSSKADGSILWVGVQTNLPPLVEWVNVHELPAPLLVLTNFEGTAVTPETFGFRSGLPVTIERWTPDHHLDCLQRARVALDIKGVDFRSRHKPPAKALDFLAAGLPLALDQSSSSADHLAEMGFAIAEPEDTQRWFSPEYAAECRRFGMAIRELYSRTRIGLRWWHLLKGLIL